jgi:hypothetical protein
MSIQWALEHLLTDCGPPDTPMTDGVGRPIVFRHWPRHCCLNWRESGVLGCPLYATKLAIAVFIHLRRVSTPATPSKMTRSRSSFFPHRYVAHRQATEFVRSHAKPNPGSRIASWIRDNNGQESSGIMSVVLQPLVVVSHTS